MNDHKVSEGILKRPLFIDKHKEVASPLTAQYPKLTKHGSLDRCDHQEENR